jgi:hypothetical protein
MSAASIRKQMLHCRKSKRHLELGQVTAVAVRRSIHHKATKNTKDLNSNDIFIFVCFVPSWLKTALLSRLKRVPPRITIEVLQIARPPFYRLILHDSAQLRARAAAVFYKATALLSLVGFAVLAWDGRLHVHKAARSESIRRISEPLADGRLGGGDQSAKHVVRRFRMVPV